MSAKRNIQTTKAYNQIFITANLSNFKVKLQKCVYHFLLCIGLILNMYKCTRESNYLQIVNLDYGKTKDNPIDLAVFYNKENRNKPLNIRKTEVIYFKLK